MENLYAVAAIDEQIQTLAEKDGREDAAPVAPSGTLASAGSQVEAKADAAQGEPPPGAARRPVRCPRHNTFTMEEAPADPRTGEGRILRCTVAGCHMVERIPGAELLRRALLNRKQRERQNQASPSQ